jgi:hypothetical protein
VLGREKRKVRLFVQDGPTIDGVLVGRTRKDRDYIVWAPRVVEDDERTHVVSGHVEVPVGRVLWVQILG